MPEKYKKNDLVWVRSGKTQSHINRVEHPNDDGKTISLESLIGATAGFFTPLVVLEAIHRKVTKKEKEIFERLSGRVIMVQEGFSHAPREIYDVYLHNEKVVFTFHDPKTDRLMGPYPVTWLDHNYYLTERS